jgi:hypothetical protein
LGRWYINNPVTAPFQAHKSWAPFGSLLEQLHNHAADVLQAKVDKQTGKAIVSLAELDRVASKMLAILVELNAFAQELKAESHMLTSEEEEDDIFF